MPSVKSFKVKQSLEFRRRLADHACEEVYPELYKELKEKGKWRQALAIGFSIMNGLRKGMM